MWYSPHNEWLNERSSSIIWFFFKNVEIMKRLVGAEYWHRFVKVLGVGYTFDKAQQQMDMSSFLSIRAPSLMSPSWSAQVTGAAAGGEWRGHLTQCNHRVRVYMKLAQVLSYEFTLLMWYSPYPLWNIWCSTYGLHSCFATEPRRNLLWKIKDGELLFYWTF